MVDGLIARIAGRREQKPKLVAKRCRGNEPTLEAIKELDLASLRVEGMRICLKQFAESRDRARYVQVQ